MPNVVLDSDVHRTITLGVPLTGNGTSPVLTVKTTTDTSFPEGQYLEVDFGSNMLRLHCPGFTTTANRGCVIGSVGSSLQFNCPVDDNQNRILLMGNELVSDPGYSVVIVNRVDPASGDESDVILFRSDAAAGSVIPANSDVPAGGDGVKVPPYVNLRFH
jgi:hypothetical protein